jgi:hypothetical protein
MCAQKPSPAVKCYSGATIVANTPPDRWPKTPVASLAQIWLMG